VVHCQGSSRVILEMPAKQGGSRTYTVDSVFGAYSTQAQVFDDVAKPVVEEVLQGFNETIFAYGQTGSGKTWTTFGRDDEDAGLIPRTVAAVFEKTAGLDAAVRVSLLEIYNEELCDLLSDGDFNNEQPSSSSNNNNNGNNNDDKRATAPPTAEENNGKAISTSSKSRAHHHRDIAETPRLEEFIKVLELCDGLELCFLNACNSYGLANDILERLGGTGLCLICWKSAASDKPASTFARYFYEQIGTRPCIDLESAFHHALARWKKRYRYGDPHDAPRKDARPHGMPCFLRPQDQTLPARRGLRRSAKSSAKSSSTTTPPRAQRPNAAPAKAHLQPLL